MNPRQRIVVAVIATLVVAVVGGGVNTGLTLAKQQSAEARRTGQPARPAQTAQHGVVGLLVRVDGDRLVVRDRQRQLREVRVVGKTEVRSGGKRVGRSALVPGARVAVIGAPAPNRVLVARLVSVSR